MTDFYYLLGSFDWGWHRVEHLSTQESQHYKKDWFCLSSWKSKCMCFHSFLCIWSKRQIVLGESWMASFYLLICVYYLGREGKTTHMWGGESSLTSSEFSSASRGGPTSDMKDSLRGRREENKNSSLGQPLLKIDSALGKLLYLYREGTGRKAGSITSSAPLSEIGCARVLDPGNLW